MELCDSRGGCFSPEKKKKKNRMRKVRKEMHTTILPPEKIYIDLIKPFHDSLLLKYDSIEHFQCIDSLKFHFVNNIHLDDANLFRSTLQLYWEVSISIYFKNVSDELLY